MNNELGEKGDRFTNHTHWPADMNVTAGSPRKGNDWKPLEVDNLPPDILTGDYEFDIYAEMRMLRDRKLKEVLNKLQSGYKCFYRPRPQKKTVEEMAEEYSGKYSIGFGADDDDDEFGSMSLVQAIYDKLQGITKAAFIAGHKAKEPENVAR